MPTYPFYRFSNAQPNAFFDPESNRIIDILDIVKAEIEAISLSGLSYPSFSNQLKAIVAEYNGQDYQANLTITFPKPFPVLVGSNSLTITIENKQLSVRDASKVIEVDLSLTNATIDSGLVTFDNTLLPEFSTYERPLLEVEKLVAQALEVRNKNGASFLPAGFKMIGDVATTGLANAYNWIYEGYPKREAQVYPWGPTYVIKASPLKTDQKFVSTLTERVINATIGETLTYSEVIGLVANQALLLPSDWTYSTDDNGSDFVVFKWIGPDDICFTTIGRTVYGVWLFQRFISFTGDISLDWVAVYGSDELPLAPYPTRSIDGWFDFDFVNFDNSEPEEAFYMPIKTGDEYQFNVLPNFSNYLDERNVLVGIMDCDGWMFPANIGTADFPLCRTVATRDIIIGSISYASLLAFTGTVVINEENSDSVIINELLSIPFSEIDNSTITNYFQSVVDYINSLEGFSAEFEDNIISITLTITFQNPSLALDVLSYFYDPLTVSGQSGQCVCNSTQLEANCLIPSLPFGLYQFVLYRLLEGESGDSYELLAVSQPLQLDNQNEFPQILEFWNDSNTLFEGFEYLNDWKQKIRVPLNGAGSKAIIDESTYRNTDGTYQRPKAESDFSINLHTSFIDSETQKAMFSATRHKNFILSGQSLFVKGDLEIANIRDFSTNTSYRPLSQMGFEATLQGYQPENNDCLGC